MGAAVDDRGVVTGWEEQGPDRRRFSTGGSQVLFRLGRSEALRIVRHRGGDRRRDLAALEGLREGSLYLRTG
ncbi:DUF3991 domain-containing protein [Ensifer sp. MJa1]|uniref:DUF3991 domain-containing protein n=1 Tax=Ensifer sp. MJa1 TaxID=2919888 RepID=UPI00300A22C3